MNLYKQKSWEEDMLFLLDLIAALIIGFLLVALFSALFRNQVPWGSFWIFLLIVFLVTWAGGLWIGPFGPTLFDVAWLPFLLVGLFVTILLVATVPPRPTRTPMTVEQARKTEAERAAMAGLTIFFWIALIFTIVAIVLGYII
jgi:hypothetical protein